MHRLKQERMLAALVLQWTQTAAAVKFKKANITGTKDHSVSDRKEEKQTILS